VFGLRCVRQVSCRGVCVCVCGKYVCQRNEDYDEATARLHQKSEMDDRRIEELERRADGFVDALIKERDRLVARLTAVEGKAAATLLYASGELRYQKEHLDIQLQALEMRSYDEPGFREK
jgi:hypothetical protein